MISLQTDSPCLVFDIVTSRNITSASIDPSERILKLTLVEMRENLAMLPDLRDS